MDADARKQNTKKTKRQKTSVTLQENVRFEKAGARNEQTEQIPWEKCVKFRAAASPRCMGALVVAEMLASVAFGAHAGAPPALPPCAPPPAHSP